MDYPSLQLDYLDREVGSMMQEGVAFVGNSVVMNSTEGGNVGDGTEPLCVLLNAVFAVALLRNSLVLKASRRSRRQHGLMANGGKELHDNRFSFPPIISPLIEFNSKSKTLNRLWAFLRQRANHLVPRFLWHSLFFITRRPQSTSDGVVRK